MGSSRFRPGSWLPSQGKCCQVFRFRPHRFFLDGSESSPHQVSVDFFRHLAQCRPARVIKQTYFHFAAASQGPEQTELDRIELVKFAEIAFFPGDGPSFFQGFCRPGIDPGQVFQPQFLEFEAVGRVEPDQVHILVFQGLLTIPGKQHLFEGLRFQAVPGKFVEQG